MSDVLVFRFIYHFFLFCIFALTLYFYLSATGFIHPSKCYWLNSIGTVSVTLYFTTPADEVSGPFEVVAQGSRTEFLEEKKKKKKKK
jgi:hypothetical protein